MKPGADETICVWLERLLGLLAHASCHLERKNLGAVADALTDARKRAHARLDEERSRA